MATDKGLTINVDFGEPSPKFAQIMQQRIAKRNNSSLVRKTLVEEICDDLASKVQIPKDILFGKRDEDEWIHWTKQLGKSEDKNGAADEATKILQDIADMPGCTDVHELTDKIIFGNKDKPRYKKLFINVPRGCEKSWFFGPRYAYNIETGELDLDSRADFLPKIMNTPIFMPSRRTNAKPNYGIYFTTIEDVKKHFQVCDDLVTMKMIYRYRKGNIESRVAIDAFDRLQKQMTADDIFRELAKGYDKAVIEEVFKMTHFDFNEKIAMLERKGCHIEIHDELGYGQYVNVAVPFDLFRYLKIAPATEPEANNRIPPIKDIKIQNNKVVVVYFEDGSFTKSICKDDETFNVYTGVMVCLFKRMLGKDDGQKKFTRLMEKAMGFFTRKEKALKKAREEKKARIEAEKVKQNRNLRRKNKKREEQISIFAEALKRDRQAAAWENRPETSYEGI